MAEFRNFLGLLQICIKGERFINDMSAYVLEIQPYSGSFGKGDVKLNDEGLNLKAFRRLVAQLRWPSHFVMPEFLFEVSALAQCVGDAKWSDLKVVNSLLDRMKEAAKQGQAKLELCALKKDPILVTYFDASLGKTKSGASQRGEVHFACEGSVLNGMGKAAIIEFHSSKISRVVHSSMAAECASMVGSADGLLFNRKMFDALFCGKIEVASEWRQELRVPGHFVTDARSLYGHIHGTNALASERQTALDIMAIKQMIQDGFLNLHRTPTWKQFADGLTKELEDTLFRKYRQAGQISLVQTPEDAVEEERRAGLRKGQCERRKARMLANR